MGHDYIGHNFMRHNFIGQNGTGLHLSAPPARRHLYRAELEAETGIGEIIYKSYPRKISLEYPQLSTQALVVCMPMHMSIHMSKLMPMYLSKHMSKLMSRHMSKHMSKQIF